MAFHRFWAIILPLLGGFRVGIIYPKPQTPKPQTPKPLNPKPLNPKPLTPINPEPLNPYAIASRPLGGCSRGVGAPFAAAGLWVCRDPLLPVPVYFQRRV